MDTIKPLANPPVPHLDLPDAAPAQKVEEPKRKKREHAKDVINSKGFFIPNAKEASVKPLPKNIKNVSKKNSRKGEIDSQPNREPLKDILKSNRFLQKALDEPIEKPAAPKGTSFDLLAKKLVEEMGEKIRKKIHNRHRVCARDPYIFHDDRKFWVKAQAITFEAHAHLAKLHKRFELTGKHDQNTAYKNLLISTGEYQQKAFEQIESLGSIYAHTRFWRWLRWEREDPVEE